jgi:hypothetical protein
METGSGAFMISKQDPGETTDLRLEQPDVFADMLNEYQAYSARVGVLEVPEGYNSLKEITRNTMARQFKAYWMQLVVLLIGIVAVVWLVYVWCCGFSGGDPGSGS